MTAPTIRAHYEALAQVQQQFSQQTDSTRQTLQKLKQAMEVLHGGDWVGQGATKFYEEMNSAVLPTVQRLVNALDSGAHTTQAISQLMKQAEADAAKCFSLQGAGAAAAAAAVAAAALGAGVGAAVAAGATAAGAAVAAAAAGAAAVGAAARAAAAKIANDSVMDGTVSAKNAPKNVTLPDAFNKGMQDAWKDSFPGGHEQEQGGLLLKNASGDYEWVRGPGGTGGTWPPNYKDIGGNTYLGLGHTHPYDSGDVDVPYSDVDIGFLFDKSAGHQADIMVVQSGNTQFLLGRTDEFKKTMAGKSQAEIDTTVAEMQKLYADTVAAQEKAGASFADRYQAAVKAVADKYNLVYYKGTAGNLVKQ